MTFGGGMGMQYAGPSPEGAKYPWASHFAYQRASISAGEKFLSMVTVFVVQFTAPAIKGRALQGGSPDLDKIATLPGTRLD